MSSQPIMPEGMQFVNIKGLVDLNDMEVFKLRIARDQDLKLKVSLK